jgi:NAD(P)-dependent dehydrogenase (short-subunit alcohol dehydrogenase family)
MSMDDNTVPVDGVLWGEGTWRDKVTLRDKGALRNKRALRNKVALITGGASGIGQATALLFAGEGAAVAVVDIDQSGGQAVVQAIITGGGRAIFIAADVSQAADCQAAVQQTVTEWGSLDILFNNAGIIRRASVLKTTEAEWDRVMAVNVKSVFLLSKYAIPVMARAGGGVIINTASGWGLVGGHRAASYCASKGAVVLLTKAMALDHGQQNIRVNCLCPGDTDTPLLHSEAEQLGQPSQRFLAQAAQRPLQRLGRPEDIAQAALYLASDASAFVTGTSLVVDGGGLAG